MSSKKPSCKIGNKHYSSCGSILIYVLWILVVISVLAFQLASASKVITVNRSAFANQLKEQMQIESAVQFAIFKIISNQWKNKSYELNLNRQQINITIYNESGFVSIYEMGNQTLKRIFNQVSLDQTTIEELEKEIQRGDNQLRFNSFSELRQFSGIDSEIMEQLIPLISIFHEDSVNPRYSPEAVLMQLHGIDQYRVQKLKEAADESERTQIRNELVELLSLQGIELSEDLSTYYRVHVSFGGVLHRVIVKYNRQQKKYKVVLSDA